MGVTVKRDLSITLTSFFMKCAGFWLAANPAEEFRRNSARAYTVGIYAFSMWVEALDIYHSWGNFDEIIYIACNVLTLIVVPYKICILSVHRKNFLKLIVRTQENIWSDNYDAYESKVVAQCKRECTFFVITFTIFAQSTMSCYVIKPIIENIGKNESDRKLPFTMWFNLPLSMTPYFELTFVMQVIILCHIAICYFSFDNCLCIMNVHTAGQFRILQYRLSTLYGENANSGKRDMISAANYEKLKSCVRQNQSLIKYCSELEKVFTMIVLGQVMVFSLLLCLVGFEALAANATPTRRMIFIVHLMGTLCQLMIFTYTCHGLTEQSGKVAEAVYFSPWCTLPMDIAGRSLRRDLIMIIMRSRQPCCLTAGGFFPVSLETYTAVLSTAMSYFTLLRQCGTDITDS